MGVPKFNPVRDVISGLIMAATSIPQLIAYAETVGYAGYRGLVTAGPPLAAWGVTTGGCYMNAGVTSITALMAKSDLDGEAFVAEHGEEAYVELVAAYSLYIGIASILLAIVGFGKVAKSVPMPVRTGFKWGCALGVLVSALPNGLFVHYRNLKAMVANSILYDSVAPYKAMLPGARYYDSGFVLSVMCHELSVIVRSSTGKTTGSSRTTRDCKLVTGLQRARALIFDHPLASVLTPLSGPSISSLIHLDPSLTMNLEQLFTVTDYQTTVIRIPCHEIGVTAENDSEEEPLNELAIELFNSQAASTDHDLTGQILWPVSVLLSHYLASAAGQSRIRNRNVVELGAGTGLPGLVAAHYSRSVTITDGNDIVMDLVQQNVTAFESRTSKESDSNNNGSLSSSCSVTASQLIWGQPAHVQALLNRLKHVDVIIAADVVQWPAVVEPLLHTVKALLWNSDATEPAFILGIVNRATSTYDQFFQLAVSLGFESRRVQAADFLKDGVVPMQCQEFGGRTAEIHLVTLVDRSVKPVLLQKGDDSKDWTLGKSYENTAFLPY